MKRGEPRSPRFVLQPFLFLCVSSLYLSEWPLELLLFAVNSEKRRSV